MVIIGLLLLIASLIFGADLVVQNGGVDLSPTAFGVGLGNITSGGQFALGAITGFAIALGIGLILAGTGLRTRRAQHRRGELDDSRRDIEAHQVENARLREELERERADREMADREMADREMADRGLAHSDGRLDQPSDTGPYPAQTARYRDAPAYQDVPDAAAQTSARSTAGRRGE